MFGPHRNSVPPELFESTVPACRTLDAIVRAMRLSGGRGSLLYYLSDHQM
jgi:hypothetical protein